MGRSQETFNKKEVRNKKDKKRKDKEQKKLDRKDKIKDSSLDSMIAYVDENGMLTSTPPDPSRKVKVELEDIRISIPKDDSLHTFDPTRKGTVSFFNEGKGFGFIKDANSKDSIFVHVNNVLEPIKEGNAVSFEVEKGPKGLTATKVKLVRNE